VSASNSPLDSLGALGEAMQSVRNVRDLVRWTIYGMRFARAFWHEYRSTVPRHRDATVRINVAPRQPLLPADPVDLSYPDPLPFAVWRATVRDHARGGLRMPGSRPNPSSATAKP
jgi:hypothetical protein